jgi:hypothetical protein
MVYIRYLRLDDFIKNQYKIEENNMVDPLKMKVVSTYLTLVGGAVFNIDKISTARYISDVLIRNMYNDDIEIIKGVNENSYIIYLQKALKEVYKVVDRYKKSTYIEAPTKYPQWIKINKEECNYKKGEKVRIINTNKLRGIYLDLDTYEINSYDIGIITDIDDTGTVEVSFDKDGIILRKWVNQKEIKYI